MKLVLMILSGLLTLVVLVLGLWTLITLNYTYSSGERAGYVQKISQKGWVCKTWEGELAMANLPGAMPQIFTFMAPLRAPPYSGLTMCEASARGSRAFPGERR